MAIKIYDLAPSRIEELTLDRSSQIMGGAGIRSSRFAFRSSFFTRPSYNYWFSYSQPAQPNLPSPPKPDPQDCNIRCITTPCPCTLDDNGNPVYK
jgi:hypothetical protein